MSAAEACAAVFYSVTTLSTRAGVVSYHPGPKPGPKPSPPGIIRTAVAPAPRADRLRWHDHLLLDAPAFIAVDVHGHKIIGRFANLALFNAGDRPNNGHQLIAEIDRINESVDVRAEYARVRPRLRSVARRHPAEQWQFPDEFCFANWSQRPLCRQNATPDRRTGSVRPAPPAKFICGVAVVPRISSGTVTHPDNTRTLRRRHSTPIFYFFPLRTAEIWTTYALR